MTYASNRSRPATIAAVAAVHVAIGYAFLSGLAVRVIPEILVIPMARLLPDETPPPPPPEPVRRQAERAASDPQPAVPETVIDLPALPRQTLPAQPLPPLPTLPLPDVRPTVLPALAPDLSRGPSARGDRADWVTASDYPASALRAGAEGTTGIRVTVTADGRVGDCAITSPSGHDALDQAACRAYARRARFEPARDAAGHAVASTRADRVTWRLPR